ncbi:hypothetical protein KJ840_01145 [Patescibacteria group bacterium]|nr:hypothetical protein [Patescibacteria group bacterium]
MDLGTHLFTGVITASLWPSLDLRQKILVVLFSILPDCTEWLNYFSLKKHNGDSHFSIDEYSKLSREIKNPFSLTYSLLHSIFTPLIFFIISIIFNWSLVFSMMWFMHLLLDLPSHKVKLGLKLWWPLSQQRLKGFFDWWHVKFFNSWELWGYWTLLAVISFIIVKNFW